LPESLTVANTHDGYARLLSYARTGSPAQANVYNGLDDRVKVTSGSTTRAYVYDPDGRMLGEYGTSAAAPVVETIWLSPTVTNDNAPFGGDDGVGGYAPLAIAGGSGASATLYWVHGNHLGVPTVITNTSGATATPTGYTAVGFPGQTRTLADLYYNRYRDYDSTTGRYIQADPIGLGGGENPFLYANGNPLRWTDPSGLEIGNQRLFFPEFYPKPKPTNRINPDCLPPLVDWCGGSNWTRYVPEGNWAGACKTHDECYGTLGANKHNCDIALGVDIVEECSFGKNGIIIPAPCAIVGVSYSAFVQFFGGRYYRDGQTNAKKGVRR